MRTFLQTLRVITWHEVVDAFRSRRALALLLLYLLGSVAGCMMFVKVLHEVERELVTTLGLTPSDQAGSVTETLWASDAFQSILRGLVGDRELARQLLSIPPLILFYGWLSLTFAPLLVVLLSSPRIAEEVGSGSVRFVLFRAGRPAWCLGKLAGQGILLAAALLVSAGGAWLVGMFRMAGFPPLGSVPYLLAFVLKGWIFAWPYLGLALAASQMTRSPIVATALGFIGLLCINVIAAIARHLNAGAWRTLLDTVYQLTPQGNRLALWHPDAAHLVPGVVLLLVLGLAYFLIGYAVFARKDQ